VFAGTINPEGGYLKDATGARRFWPVKCGTIDLDALAENRHQLWAEARERFFADEPWWLATPELEQLAANEQADRFLADPWLEKVETYVSHPWKDSVSVGEILHALGLLESHWSQKDQNRVSACLVALGFERYRGPVDLTLKGAGKAPKRPWRYRRMPGET
jgi:predicted P-loop ATPase